MRGRDGALGHLGEPGGLGSLRLAPVTRTDSPAWPLASEDRSEVPPRAQVLPVSL